MAHIVDFYKYNLLRGQGLLKVVPWTTGVTTTTTITAAVSYHVYIARIVAFFSDNFALGGPTVDITPWGNAVPATISLASQEDFYSVASDIGHKMAILNGGDNYHWIRIDFNPFLFLDSGESFTIAHSVGETEVITGTITFNTVGCTISDTDD